MKYFLQHPDITQRFDPPGVDCVRQTPGRVDKLEEADVVFVPMARFDEFRFDEALHDKIGGKPWVLFDWCEFGWDDPMKWSYVWGENRTSHPDFGNEDLCKFDDFVRSHPPILTFQRELLEKDRTDRLLPLEYLNWLPEAGNDPPEEFKKRPIEVEFDWGRSHEARMWLHGSIFDNAGGLKYEPISEFNHLERALQDGDRPEARRKWLTVHVPHYARIDVRELQKIVQRSKITVVMPGAGVKTFRHGERCADAIMAMPKNRLAWSYPWNESNSVVLPEIKNIINAIEAVGQLSQEAQRLDLYELYGNAMANALNYRPETYGRRWIGHNIERVL